MTYVYLDCETTGLDPERHEIWEIAFAVDGGEIQSSFVRRYGPPGTTDHRGNLPESCRRCGDYPPSHKHLCPQRGRP